MGEDAAGVVFLQKLRGLLMACGHHDAAAVETMAALCQRPGDIGEVLLRVVPQMRREVGGIALQRALGSGREAEQLERPVRWLGRPARGRFFQHGMRIGATDAERIDPRAWRMIGFGPRCQPVIHPEGRAVETDRRVGLFEAERGRNLAVMQAERGLDQAGHPGGRVEMADIRLHAADAAEPLGPRGAPEGVGQRRDLDRVAQIGAGAVAFDIVDGVCGGSGDGLRFGNRFGLTANRGRQVARLVGPVIIDRRALDKRPDMIAVADRVLRAPQHDAARAGAEDRALRAVIERMALPVWREDFAFLEEIAARMRQFDGHAARQRHVTFAHEKRLCRVMRRHQRGGAGRLQVDRGAFQIENMAHPGGHEILVIAGMAQQKHAGLIDQVGVGADVEIEIAAHAAAGIDADGTREFRGRMARLFHRLPGDLHELAVLRVHDGGFFRGQAEELRIDMVEPVQRRGEGHVIGPVDQMRGLACRQQCLARLPRDCADAFAQATPIGRHIHRTRQVRGHSDNGDIVLSDALVGAAVTHRKTYPKSFLEQYGADFARLHGDFRAKPWSEGDIARAERINPAGRTCATFLRKRIYYGGENTETKGPRAP